METSPLSTIYNMVRVAEDLERLKVVSLGLACSPL
jgi:hypothetical protein